MPSYMTDINARKEQARKEREKKAAAQAAAKQYRFSDELKFNLKPRQGNDESFLSKSVKHVLGDFCAFKPALHGNQTALYLGLDSSVPGTPEVKEFESDNPFVGDLLKPKNGIHQPKLVKNGTRTDFVQPKNKTDSHVKKVQKRKPPKLKVSTGGNISVEKLQTPIKIEKILREMTQGLPPSLSDIETPVKQAGFVFPKSAHSKTSEELKQSSKKKEKASITSEKHHLKDENSNKVGKVLANTDGLLKKKTSPSRKLSSSSSSSDGSSSDSSGSSDSEDEQTTTLVQQKQKPTIKDMTKMNLNSPLLADLPQKHKNGSPLNNNYLLDKSMINGPSIPQSNTSASLGLHKLDNKPDTSLIGDNLNFLGWENEKAISPLDDNNLFADLGFIGPGGENFVDDIFKTDVDLVSEVPVMTSTQKDDTFVTDAVFENEFEGNSLPNPCLPRRRPALYRKDSEQNDGRNKSLIKSNETKDKMKSKTTRIDTSHPSVKVNSGSIGHSCLTKAQLKMPPRGKSLSESSTTSIEDSTTKKPPSKVKAPRKSIDKAPLKKERTSKRRSKDTSSNVKLNAEQTKTNAQDKNKTDYTKTKQEISTPKTNSDHKKTESPRIKAERIDPIDTKPETVNQSTKNNVSESSKHHPLTLENHTELDIKLELPMLDKSSSLLKVSDVTFDDDEFDTKLFEPPIVPSVLSPFLSPIKSSSQDSSLSLDISNADKSLFSSDTSFSHGLKPLLSPIQDILSPIKDSVDFSLPKLEQPVPMELDSETEAQFPVQAEEKPPLIPPSLNIKEEEQMNELEDSEEVKQSFTQLVSNFDEEKPSPGNCFDVIKKFDQNNMKASPTELKIKIPLHLIKLKDATWSKYKNRTTTPDTNQSENVATIVEDELIDVEGIESPLKRKRKLSDSIDKSIDEKPDVTNNLFKSPNELNLEKLIVRIDLSMLKRIPGNPIIKSVSQELKPARGRPAKKVRLESEVPLQADIVVKEEKPEETVKSAPLVTIKEEQPEINSEIPSTTPVQTPVGTTSVKKKKRGRPPKEKDISKTVVKTEVPTESTKPNRCIPEKEMNTSLSDMKSEVKDNSVCHECGTLRRDVMQDPIKVASYKKSYSAYFNEGRRSKHRADCLTDAVEKSHMYIDAALSYAQYLIGMELSGKLTTKQGVGEYSQITSSCIDLVEYVITRFGRKSDVGNSYDRRFVLLCLRLQSILYLKLFNVKKDSAFKFSKIISEYYKQYKPSNDPSPYHKPVQKIGSTGTPSPSSPSPGPSPGGSVASIGSAGSSGSTGSNDKTTNGVAGAFVTIPSDMHEKTYQYVQNTKYLLHSHRLWDDAELLTAHCQVFLSHVSRHAGVLSMQSSMLHLVDYVKNGLKFIKDSPPPS